VARSGTGRPALVALVAAVLLTGCAGQAAPQSVPPGCKRFVTLDEVAREFGLPVTGVASDDLGECRFMLGEQTALTVVAGVDQHPDDAHRLRAVDLEHLPDGGAGSSYEVGEDSETLRAASGEAFFTLSLWIAAGAQPPPVTDIRPKLVALAGKVVDRV
jgi:hypothetical protein